MKIFKKVAVRAPIRVKPPAEALSNGLWIAPRKSSWIDMYTDQDALDSWKETLRFLSISFGVSLLVLLPLILFLNDRFSNTSFINAHFEG